MTLLKFKKLGFYIKIMGLLLIKCKNPWVLLKVLFHTQTIVELSNGIKFCVSTPVDVLIMVETLLLDCYSVRELQQPKIVIDVGAAFGDFSIWVKSLFPECKVIAFEPVLSSFQKLQKNLELNNISGIDIYNNAVGKPGSAQLYSSSYGPTGSSLKQISPGILPLNVDVVALDKVFTNEEIDLLKVDCEGAEVDVLNSISDINFAKIKKIVLEYHEMYVPGQVQTLSELLQKHKFAYTQIEDQYIKGLGYIIAWRQKL